MPARAAHRSVSYAEDTADSEEEEEGNAEHLAAGDEVARVRGVEQRRAAPTQTPRNLACPSRTDTADGTFPNPNSSFCLSVKN